MTETAKRRSGRLLATMQSLEQLHAVSEALKKAGTYPAAAYGPDPDVGLIVPGDADSRSYLRIVLAIGALAACAIFALESYGSVVAYPINASNKPLFAWPAFWVTSMDGGLLVAIFLTAGLFLFRSNLPRWHRDDVPELVATQPDAFHALIAVGEDDEIRIRGIVISAAPGVVIKWSDTS